MKMLSDEVERAGDVVIIHAANPMDWPVREFCKVPIWFEGRKYFLRTKRDGPTPPGMIYELQLWPENLHEASARGVIYDKDYVAERDRQARTNSRNSWLYLLLLPFYPVLGLFWSGFKRRMLEPIGFEQRSITNASIILTANLCIVQAIFTGWLLGGTLTHLLGQPLRLMDWAVLLLLAADCLLRIGQALQSDVEDRWGFCEWLRPKPTKGL